jgi:hypothetical protein
MPAFEVDVTGVTLVEWADPARPAGTVDAGDPGAPSRVNSKVGTQQKMRLGTVGTPIELTATLTGVVGPLDATLWGDLFIAWIAEQPVVTGLVSPAGQSSVQSFTPTAPGHYTVGMFRAGSGAVIVHFDVEAA